MWYVLSNIILDFEITKIFLMVYPRFRNPESLLGLIFYRFEEIRSLSTDPKIINGSQLRLLNVVKYWIEHYWSDFTQKMKFSLLILMLECGRQKNLLDISKQIYSILVTKDIILEANEEIYWWHQNYKKNEILSIPQTTRIKRKDSLIMIGSWISDYDPLNIAQQITVLDYRLFVKIKV